MDRVESAILKVKAVERIDPEDCLSLYINCDLITLGLLADGVKRRLHPGAAVTYIKDRNINYTNVCISGCAFCAFFRPPGHAEGYVLSDEELFSKIEETVSLGGVQILLQGGLHPELDIDYYVGMLRFIKANFDIHVHGFSPPEIVHIASLSNISVKETLARLMDAGLGSMPGGGAEILSDRVRARISPKKCTSFQWLAVMEQAHGMGLRTTATMMFGHLETPLERIEHLQKIRDLQDRTRGFTAFIPWSFQPKNTALRMPEATLAEYLRTLAISRIFLDNVDNIQASWVTQGLGGGQVALAFGANDMGSTMLEENVVKAAGVSFSATPQDIERVITDAGFAAETRNTFYEVIEG